MFSLLHHFFLGQVEREPRREAVVWGESRCTYAELARRAHGLTLTLASLGVGPEVPVGVCMQRTPDMVASLLAVLQAGGAYLPLDPKYPRERLRFMLEDAGAPVVLTDAASASALPACRARRLSVDGGLFPGDGASRSPARCDADPANLAYLIYTSGSTGRPKGVAICHASAVHLMSWAGELFTAEDLSGVLASTSICFDLSVFEIFAPLSWGGRVILADSALDLPSLPAAGEVTLVNTVPSAAAELVRSGGFPRSVRTVNLAGEALQRSLVDRLYASTSAQAVFNLYGPSEDTTYSTWVRVPREQSTAPTIGVPLPQESAHVLGPGLLLAAERQEGELFLGGPALARGYFERADLTAERFLPDPFATLPGSRMYKTGDLVRLRLDSEFDFLGRIDHQVKIRGFRIELGEIEAALLAHPGVRECVVVARHEESGPRLVAYAAPGDVPIPELRQALASRLPEHMVPSAFVMLPALPLTPNGKVDRKALPAPGRARPPVGPYVAPGDPVEERLAAIWAEALELEQVGATDGFFDLGGHSLLAGRLLSRVRQAFGADLSLRDLFAAPTVSALANLLRVGSVIEVGIPLAGAAGGGEAVLSLGQERLLFLHRLEAEPITYNVGVLGTLSGELDVRALERAFTEIVRRHEPLRTVYSEVQMILPPGEVPLPVCDLSGLPGRKREEAALRVGWEELRRPLNLERGPVLRIALVRLGAREHRLILKLHHIAWDDGSVAVLRRELPALYRAFAEGFALSLPPLPARYADFAAWQRTRLEGEELEALLDRWVRQQSGLPEPLELPTDRPRPAVMSRRGGERQFSVPEPRAAALRHLGRRQGATPFMACLALFQTLMLRLTGQEDVLVAAPVSIRTRVELELLIGFFVNNLQIRTSLGGDPAFRELVARVRETVLAALELKELSLDLAVHRVDPRMSGAALLRVIFSLFDEIPPVELAPGLAMTLREVGNGTAKADLSLFVENRRDGSLGGRLEYAADLFDAATVQRIEGCLSTLLEGAASESERRLSELPLLSAAQRAQLFSEWNDTTSELPRDACVHELVEAQAALRPHDVAVEEDDCQVTYRELNRRSNRLAQELLGLGVGPEAVVGICLRRSAELVVSLLAVLKAGAAYLPLDPDYPRERLSFMLADSGARALVTSRELLESFGETPPVLLLDGALAAGSDHNPPSGAASLGLAYVLYTSGSTGRPKGVGVTHRGIVRLLVATDVYDLGPQERIAHTSNISFDPSTVEIWGPLIHGGRVVVIRRGLALLPGEMEEKLRGHRVTTMLIPAAVMQQLAASRPSVFASLDNLLFGAEAADPQRVAEILAAGPPRRLVNAYGPTECTTMATWHAIREVPAGAASLPIGRPLANTAAVVLDRRQVPVPPGVAGELCLGGDGLARGYLGRPDLTAERFIPDPVSGEPGARLYRTGDLVLQRPDGVLEFLGRIDRQVKIRGLRIELGEIESALRALPLLREAAVEVRRLAGGPRLVAYVVRAPGAPDDLEGELQRLLKVGLPLHMVPSCFVFVDALPLTPAGKVDRWALPDPEPAERVKELVAPRDPVEEALAMIWCEVLGRDCIGVRDDFFDLGGHSLLAMRVISRVRETLGADVVLRDLFDAPTIAALAERIASRERAKLPPIVPVPRRRELPLSYAQHRLWFLERMGIRPGTYNVPMAWRIEGDLDASALGAALAEVARRHEVLRTRFPARDGVPVQCVSAPSAVAMPRIELSGLPPGARQREAERLARAEASAPFDLEAGPVLRARLFGLAQSDHLWLVNFHHAVTDGWSCPVFGREVSQLYSAFVAGRPSPLSELPVQYADYAVWQRQWLESGVLAEQLAWWTRKLEGLEALELPADRPRPPVPSWRGASLARRLPVELAGALGPLGRAGGASRFMILLAVSAALLERYTGQRDLALGTPVANRNRPEIEGLIGFFVNTLALRVDCDAAASFADLLARVRESVLAAWARPDLPFERLVEELRPERQLSRNPLFQVMLTYQGEAGKGLELAGLAVSEAAVETVTAKFDLTLGIWDRAGELAVDLEYNVELFDAATIERMALGFERLLAEAAARPGDSLASLDVLGESGRRQLLAWGQGEGAEVAATIVELFEEQVRRAPHGLALRHAGGEMTYGELDARAGALAAVLMAEGVGPDRLAGLVLERSPEAIVAILAILKAGGAFAPLDPAYPAERLAFMLEDLAAPVLITRRGLAGRLPETAARVLCWEDLEEDSRQGRGTPGRREVSPENLAYVMYTSGSTGRPKGVAVTHRNVVRLVRGSRYAELGGGHVFLHLGPLSFDATTLEIGYSLLSGSALAIPPPETPSLAELGGFLVRHRVTAAWLTAGLFHQMVEDQLASLTGLRLLLTGGDVVSPPHVARLLAAAPGMTVVNGYGPTEGTAFTSCHALRSVAQAQSPLPIGRPLGNTRVAVVDRHLRLAAPGVMGELWVGGEGLARGYLHRPELTAERFVPDPFGEEEGERLYRTGDLVRWRGDGVLEFLGRVDQQVKLRGFRVEPGEIEAVLASQPQVAAAAVVVQGEGGDKRLAAFWVGAGEVEPDLRGFLGARLPSYMVPSAFVRLEALPLDPHGKVDRRALARLAPVRQREEAEREAPRNAVEEILAGIWAELLGLERVGIRDDFFAIGGHSLLATRVISRVRRDFGTDLPLRRLFEHPTVAELAEVLAAAGGSEAEIPRRESPADRFPLSFSQLRLWLLDRLEPGTSAYNIPLPLRLDGALDPRALERGLAALVQRHEALRTVFTYERGEPLQVVVPGSDVRIPGVDLSALPAPRQDEEARRLDRLELWRGFDLSRWPLLRATLVRREPRRHDLLLVIHHAVADGWSMGVLFRELGELYEAFAQDRPSALPELPVQYPDFALWQRGRLQGAYLDGLLGYWRGRLAGAGQVLELPTDRPRPPVLTHRGAHAAARLPQGACDRLRQREGRGRTAFMILLGAMETLLSRWSGQDDFCIGTFIANRNRAETEGLIGFFVNTLVLRAGLGALGGRPSFDRLLDQVREETVGAYTHQDLPLERLLEALQPARDPSRTPVFQVMLSLLNMPQAPLRFGGLTMSHLPVDLRRSNFDLTFWFQPDERGMEFAIEYSTDLFDRSTIERLQGQFARLLEAALAHPETLLDRLPLLGDDERRQVLADWNRTAAETGPEVPVHALFAARARRVPDKPAVEAAGVALTYAELDRRSTALARALCRRGVGPETVVGVALRRSPEMLVALLAVLKAGGAYLALDPDYPRERRDFMIQDAGAGLVLTSAESGEEEGLEPAAADPANLAYVIYTSGSTGRPKGVMVTHRALSNHTASAVAGYEIRESDRILQFAALSFDTSAEEIWPCLAAGATLVLRDDSMLASAGQLLAAVERLEITVLNFPTAFWHEVAGGLEREGIGLPPAVRMVIVGGERMLPDRMESWFRALEGRGGTARLMNSYGPTEGTIVAARAEVEPGHLAPSGEALLGRPIHNVRIYALERTGEPSPIGVAGELYLGGMGVARGYLGRPDLTAERFVPDPFASEPGARLYRTGDRARWLACGELDFLGRLDQQVKIRGFRVEVGEVEEALRRLPGVRDAVVEARPDGSGTYRLVAWAVPENGMPPADLRAALKERLPDYMVPSVLVPIGEVPKTPSGKVDRSSLPEPAPPRSEGAAAHAEPQSELERVICGVWQQVLGLERVGSHDNFFDLGGHSLLLVQAHGLLRETLGRDLDVMVLFQRPTVNALAQELARAEERPSFAHAQELVARPRRVNVGRKQLMERLMQQRKRR